jgi:F0F1-type ATP synthase assembly protein I
MRGLKPNRDNLGSLDLASVGITLALAIGIGTGAGWWLGEKLGKPTAGLIVGFMLGTAAGFMEMFRAVARWNRRIERQEREDRETDEPNGGQK